MNNPIESLAQFAAKKVIGQSVVLIGNCKQADCGYVNKKLNTPLEPHLCNLNFFVVDYNGPGDFTIELCDSEYAPDKRCRFSTKNGTILEDGRLKKINTHGGGLARWTLEHLCDSNDKIDVKILFTQ